MPTGADISNGLYGAWRLLLLDRSGFAYFDDTIEAFWKSFYAAIIVAPGYVILVAIFFPLEEVTSGPFRIFLIKLIAYVIGWVAFPLVMYHVCEWADKSQHYIRYIIAFNWANVVQIYLLLPIRLLTSTGLFPEPIGNVISVAAWAFLTLFYRWFIARAGLELLGFGAAGVVVLELMIGIIITRVADGMLL